MQANDIKLTSFLSQNKTQFIIPVYQRNYDWTILQCKQLLDDILEVGTNQKRKAHFVGSIVYIHDDIYSVSKVKELTIIDGQQRLTTITLIFIVIYQLARALGKQEFVEEIEETYLTNKFAKEREKLKLRPTENNDKALKYLLRNDELEEYLDYSRVIENFNYFKGRINIENYETVLAGLNKLMFVEISLDREKDDPQRIFESLNSTGLDLSQADLIRNYILMGLKYNDQQRIYKKYWQAIEKNATKKDTNKNRVSDFIRDYLTMENREIPTKNKVYLEFKKKYNNKNLNALEIVLQKIKRFSVFYNKLINPLNEKDEDLQRYIKYINKLEINVSYPFLIEIYEDYEKGSINKDTFAQILELIQSFVWRRFIIGLPTNALNKIFMRLYEEIKSKSNKDNYYTAIASALLKKKGSMRFPRDSEIESILREKDMYGIKSRNRNYFLERLENFQNREPVRIEGNNEITIEHIFPQNPHPKWKHDLGTEEYKLIKEKYLNTISNLTLSGNNGSLGNAPFLSKRDMNENDLEQGYKFSRLWLNKYLAELDKWDLEEISKRFEIILDRFFKIWSYPNIRLEEEEDYDEVNIFDAEDPKHKKLEYVIFFDQKIQLTQVAELYKVVLTELFELQPQTFFTTDLGERLQLTKDKNSLRQWARLNDTYFFESNLDNVRKFDRIKYALSILGIEDELIVKYSNN